MTSKHRAHGKEFTLSCDFKQKGWFNHLLEFIKQKKWKYGHHMIMDLVVVFLVDIGKHVIVPEKYVYDLNISQLKNRGKNASRNFLVYYTDDCVECVYYPDPISGIRIWHQDERIPSGSWGMVLRTNRFFYR